MTPEEAKSVSPVKIGLYVIRDSVADSCSAPFPAESYPLAKRQFRIAMKNAPDEVRESCYLHHVGWFDSQFGDLMIPRPGIDLTWQDAYWKDVQIKEVTYESEK